MEANLYSKANDSFVLFALQIGTAFIQSRQHLTRCKRKVGVEECALSSVTVSNENPVSSARLTEQQFSRSTKHTRRAQVPTGYIRGKDKEQVNDSNCESQREKNEYGNSAVLNGENEKTMSDQTSSVGISILPSNAAAARAPFFQRIAPSSSVNDISSTFSPLLVNASAFSNSTLSSDFLLSPTQSAFSVISYCAPVASSTATSAACASSKNSQARSTQTIGEMVRYLSEYVVAQKTLQSNAAGATNFTGCVQGAIRADRVKLKAVKLQENSRDSYKEAMQFVQTEKTEKRRRILESNPAIADCHLSNTATPLNPTAAACTSFAVTSTEGSRRAVSLKSTQASVDSFYFNPHLQSSVSNASQCKLHCPLWKSRQTQLGLSRDGMDCMNGTLCDENVYEADLAHAIAMAIHRQQHVLQCRLVEIID